MLSKNSEKIALNKDKKSGKILQKKTSTKSTGQIITNYQKSKPETKEYNIIIENAKNKLSDILEDKSIPDIYKKDFIDIDIKLSEKEDEKMKKKANNDSKNIKCNTKSEINILNYLNNLTKIFVDCQNKFKSYKEQLDKLLLNENDGNILKSSLNTEANDFGSISEMSEKANKKQNLEMNDIDALQNNFSKVSININASKISKNNNNKETKSNNFNRYELELNELRAEICLFKMRYEIYRTKSLFYENIFNTVKNAIENFSFEIKTNFNSNPQENDVPSNINKAFNNFSSNNSNSKKTDLNSICYSLKEKLNLILTQNNKYYYQEFQDKFNCFEYRNYNFCNKDWDFDSDQKVKNNQNEKYVKNLDKSISEILIIINNFLKEGYFESNINNSRNNIIQPINNQMSNSQMTNQFESHQMINSTLTNLKIKLFICLKSLLSVYLTGENLNFEIRSKNSFILERENEYLIFEQAERKSKLLKELISIIQPNLNKVINNKFKNEMVDKISNIINFYENFNLILKNENVMLKNQLNQISKIKDFKINSICKIVDQFLIFSEPTITKIKELTDITSSVNLKNKEKLLSAFMNIEFNNFYDLIDKYFDLKNKFYSYK